MGLYVNSYVTAKSSRSGYRAPMREPGKFPNELRVLAQERGITQADLVRATGESKQTIYKIWHGDIKLDKDWAVKFEPILSVPWIEIMGWKPPEDDAAILGALRPVAGLAGHRAGKRAANVKEGVAVRKLDPKPGDPIDDLDEAALVGMWRKLSITKRAALFGYLGFDDMPSLLKAN